MLMKPPEKKEKVVKFLEETKEKWKQVEIHSKVKTTYEKAKYSETANLARSSVQVIQNKVRIYMADIGMGPGIQLI